MNPSLATRPLFAALLVALPAAAIRAQDITPAPAAPAPAMAGGSAPAAPAEPAVQITGTMPATLPKPSPAPEATASPMPEAAPSVTATSATAAASASPAATAIGTRKVKLQFLPPPMDGTISLGIYDGTGRLVRTLHRYAAGGEFVAALDGYITHWDGLDDSGKPSPAGSYDARGYAVGALAVRPLPLPAASGTDAPDFSTPASAPASLPGGRHFAPQAKLRVALVGNPLDRDRAGSADLAAAWDAKGSWLALANGLPLKQVSTTPGLRWAAISRGAPGELIFAQSDGKTLEVFLIGKVTQMMAFDCGEFELPAAK